MLRDGAGRELILGMYWDYGAEQWTHRDDGAFRDHHAVSVAAVDWDDDGDLDLLLGTSEGTVVLWPNEGDAQHPAFAADALPVTTGAAGDPLRARSEHAMVTVADWDQDGLWDVLIGGDAGEVSLARNEGRAGAPRLASPRTLVDPPRTDDPTRPSGSVQVAVADWNGDGLVDLLLGDHWQGHDGDAFAPPTHHGRIWLYPREPEDAFGDASWLGFPAATHPLEHAEWTWAASPSHPAPTTADAPPGAVRLVADFDLAPPLPADATLWLAADNRAEARVNGIPAGASEDWASPSALALAGMLREGANRLELDAVNGPGNSPGNPAGVLAVLELRAPDGATLVVLPRWEAPGARVVRLGPAGAAPWRFHAPDGPCPIFRHEFDVDGPLLHARLAIAGLGHFQLRVNGARAGDAIGQPWSQYDRRIVYQELDLTALLRPGRNALGVLLGNGFWRVAAPPPGRWTKGDAMPDFSAGSPWLLRARLELEYAGGRRVTIASGPDWKATLGPVVLSHVYAGEDFDARREPPGWDRPGFDDTAWRDAALAAPPAGTLSRQDFPGLREHEVFQPVAIQQLAEDRWSYSFAQNCSAVARFRVRGAAGATIVLKPSEVITEAGVVEQLNLHGSESLFAYTLRGGGDAEDHQWLFHYHGGQFVELRGAVPAGRPNPRGLPEVDSLELVHLRAANPVSGRFACSEPLYGRIHDLVDWAMRSNMSWVLTDCPHREKLGWLECAHLLARSFLARYDCAPWLGKIARDIGDAQLESGRILTVAPRYLMRPPDDPYAWTVEWGAAGALLPWELYLWDGDAEALRARYPVMRAFVDHVAALSPRGIAPGALGDWYDYGHGQSPGPSRFTPTDLTATACWAMCLEAVAEAARVLGLDDDAAHYRALRERVGAAFVAEFYDPQARAFRHHGSPQTAHAMALCADLVPETDRAAVLAAILEDLEQRGGQQTAGDVGHLYFIRALAEAGRSDVLHRVYSRTGTGSYGGILAKGLTTLPETWDAITVGSNSLNHCMLGHVMEWFYGWVLGLRQEPESVGWSHALVAPEPGPLSWCRGEVGTPLGPLRCAWQIDGDVFRLSVEVPEGMTATVVLPEGYDGPVTQNGREAAIVPGAFGRHAVVIGPGSHAIAGTPR